MSSISSHLHGREATQGGRDFSRILPALFAGLVGLGGLAMLAWGALSARAAPLNPLMAYGGLLMAVSLLAALAALGGFRRLAWALAGLAALDLSFGLGTRGLAALGLRNSFLPMKTVSLAEGRRFTYHPLLQGVPTPGFDNGFFVHDGKGRRRIMVPAAKEDARIALVGGSSTYDLGVSAGRTWPDVLQGLLPQARLFNYGVPGYSTSEHIVQTAYYLAPEKISCAVYYVGWNDIRNSFLPTLDPAYADYHLLGHVDFMRIRAATGISSIYNFLANARLVRRFTSFIPSPADYRGWKPRSGIDRRLEAIYRRNLHTLKAINDSQGRTTVFIPQILNYARLKGAGRYGWFPLVADGDVPPINEHFNRVLKEEAEAMGAAFVDVSPARFEDSDFVDMGHFSEKGAAKFARMIAPAIRAACLTRQPEKPASAPAH